MNYIKSLSLMLIFLSLNVKASDVEINGYVRNYTGVLFNEDADYSIVQNTLDLSLTKSDSDIGFMANIFAYQYPDKDIYFDVRELYIDLFSDKIDLRIGKQQIIWGQADGVFITDIISPKNLSEFLLWDFNEIRMGLTALKMKFYPVEDHDIELVWIPMFTPTLSPEAGSIWYPKMDLAAPATFDLSKNKVESNLKNSEFFARYTLSTSAVDLQIIGGYTWDDDPSIHVQKQFTIDTTVKLPLLTGLTITPQHHRLNIVGGSFSTDIYGFIVRGEGAYYQNKYFQTTDPTAEDALIKKDYLNYVIGLDKTIGDWRLSTQFIQKVILDYDEQIQNDEVDNLATVLVSRTLFRETLRLELFSYLGLNNEDAFVRLRGYYFPSDGISVELGFNIFFGDEGMFGQYKDNNMVYTRIKYSF